MMKKDKFYMKYFLFRTKILILLENIRKDADLSFIDRVKWANRGFLTESYYLYNLNENKYEYYISDYEREKTQFINKENSIILNNKIIFDSMIKELINTPKIYSIILDGIIYPYTNELLIDNIEELFNQILSGRNLVLKPYIDTGGGGGVYICKSRSGNIFVNNEKLSKDEFKKLISKLHKYIVTEYIEQHDYSVKLFPESVNTIRILIMENPQTKRKFIPIAVHRIGTKKSNTVDNWAKGGLSALIDIDKGTLGKATSKSINNKITWHSRHPDTNAQIEGIKIPNWKLIRDKVLSASNFMPFLKYIAWDIVVTRDGFSVIEANNSSGVNVLQVHKPLLFNKKVRKFYKHHKII